METPKEIHRKRREFILSAVGDLDVKSFREIEVDNIAAFRTSFYNYLVKYNQSQVLDKKFSILKESGNTYRVWREQ